jgi:hypothetical protein
MLASLLERAELPMQGGDVPPPDFRGWGSGQSTPGGVETVRQLKPGSLKAKSALRGCSDTLTSFSSPFNNGKVIFLISIPCC